MSKKIKDFELGAMRTALAGVKDFVVVEPIKVDSATDADFRKTLRDKKISVKMVKNSLAKKVMGENGVASEFWAGNTLLCWGGDSVKALANSRRPGDQGREERPEGPGQVQGQGGHRGQSGRDVRNGEDVADPARGHRRRPQRDPRPGGEYRVRTDRPGRQYRGHFEND